MKRNAITILISILTIGGLITQEISHSYKEIGFSIGWSSSSIRDVRLSNQNKDLFNPVFGIHFNQVKTNTRSNFNMAFKMDKTSRNDSGMGLQVILPEVRYNFQFKSANTWIGPSFHSSSLLVWPRSNDFGNNPIAYTLSKNLGVAVDRSWASENQDMRIDAGIETSILSYVVRPAFGHPYPEAYLEEGTFHPTRAGIGRAMIKSGKLRTPRSFQNFQIKLGFRYNITEQISISTNYNMHIQNLSAQQDMRLVSHDFLLGFNYQYQ